MSEQTGAPQSGGCAVEEKKEKWYFKTWFVVLMLLFVSPAGLVLMWLGKKWTKAWRIVITVIVLLILIGGYCLERADMENVHVSGIEVNNVTQEADASVLSELAANEEAEKLLKKAGVVLGTLEQTDNFGYVTSALPATVTNNTDQTRSFTIQFEAVDDAGNRIADDTLLISNLAPGQSVTKKIFTLVPSDQQDALAAASVRVYGGTSY